MQERRIIEAFTSNEITEVLLIDDAYDPPVLDSRVIALLADYLEKDADLVGWIDHGIDQDVLCDATNAALVGESDSDALKRVYHTLYAEFVRTEERKFDPGGCFDLYKGAALAALRPLYSLLCKCGNNMSARTAGLEGGAELYSKHRPQILFLDYYLDRGNPAGSDLGDTGVGSARDASLNFLRQVITDIDEENIPAIVLMSSQQIDDVQTFRHEVKDKQIMSLRFQYMRKEWIRQNDDQIIIDHSAADVLLDMSQGYIFGRLLQQALTQWRMGAEQALNSFMRQIGNLDMKDFAYLLRFRLREEGQVLSEYLEWLFGEYLKGLIDKKINWEHSSFSRLNHDDEIEDKIEGAFDGPTIRIAEFFHDIRVSERQANLPHRYQLGDLYANRDGNDIRSVITPDCDLVVRKGKAKIKRILTMGGTLHTFAQEGSAAEDLILRGNTPYSVQWNPKDLETFPIEGEEALHESENFQFFGTLRPLYAQEMQRRVLTDLSRVGLPVAPAFGINATATVWMRQKGDFKSIQMEKSSPLATIIPARIGRGHRILLRRHFVNELIDRLKTENRQDMTEQDYNFLESILKDIDKFYKQFLQEGGIAKTKGVFGTGFVVGDRPNRKQDAPWLQIVVKISEEEMEELEIIDPLASSSNQSED